MEFQPVTLSPEEKNLLQARLVDMTEQAILVIDLTGQIVFWNRYAESIYGMAANELQGRNITEVLSTLDLGEPAFEQLQNGESWSGKVAVQGKNGTNFITHINALPIEIGQNTLICIFEAMQESSARQHLLEANRLLAEVGGLLVDSVDYEVPLTALAQLTVPQMADCCAIHLQKANGSLELAALAPVDTVNQLEIQNWLNNYLLQDKNKGIPAVLESGKPVFVTGRALNKSTTDRWISSYMIVPLIARPKTLGSMTFVAMDSGRRFDVNSLALAENLASHIAIYLERARLYQESQRLNTELEQRVSQRTAQLHAAIEQVKLTEEMNQTLFRISKKLNSTLDVETILDELAQEAIRIVDGESGFAGLRTAQGMSMTKYFHKGVAIPFEHAWPIGVGIPGWVLANKVPYGTSDAASDPMMLHKLSINHNVHSVICTPILDSAGEVLAYFDIRNKQGREGFSISDQEMLMALAPVASIAIQNALAYQQRLVTVAELKESSSQLEALNASIESAREEERTKIARELHDQLGQALTAMKFDLAWLTNSLGEKDASLAQKAENVKAQVDVVIKTVRRIATELRPGMLDDLGLAASLEWQARDFEKRTGITCTVRVSMPSENLALSHAQSVAMFRIFQEALTNIARHANAQHIEVRLVATPERLTLRVQDDGRGIQAREITSRTSLGLLGMRERAKGLGGTFGIQGSPEGGTTVTVSIPLGKVFDVSKLTTEKSDAENSIS